MSDGGSYSEHHTQRYRRSLEWIVLYSLQKNKTRAYREILMWKRHAAPELLDELNRIIARLRIGHNGVYYLADESVREVKNSVAITR